jgi:hypothetical protein
MVTTPWSITEQQRRRVEPIFFFFLSEPAMMASSITVELNPTSPKTGGNGHFEPVVMGR